MNKIYLEDVLAWFSADTFVRIQLDEVKDRYVFGVTGSKSNDDILHCVERMYRKNPEVYEISHLDGFKKGVALKVR